MRSTPLRGRAGQPRHRDQRPGEIPRRPGLFPLLGPTSQRSSRRRRGGRSSRSLTGPAANRDAFIAAAGGAYPRMANFSFDYGNAHWTVLDSNPYVDWTNPELRAWVERDLAAAQNRTWRFVAFHHPGFNSSKAHFNDQQMRLLAEVFEAGRVDVVFSGHVHNYQRTFPLRFSPDRGADGKPVRDVNKVPGRWTLDKLFDGRMQHAAPGRDLLRSPVLAATRFTTPSNKTIASRGSRSLTSSSRRSIR